MSISAADENDQNVNELRFAPKIKQMFESELKEADIKVRHKFDRLVEQILILAFESSLVRENVSLD